MPFTAAHPAAVLLLRNRFRGILPWSALVIGSITPDLHHFLIGIVRGNSHTVAGLLTFCLPAGMLTWIAFHTTIKRPLTRLVPDSFLPKLWKLATRRIAWTPALFFRAAIAVILGAASHILWDSFTHQEGRMVRDSYTLSHSVIHIDGYTFTIFSFLQHTSTVVGMLVLAIAFVIWYRRQPPVTTDLPTPLSALTRCAILATLAIATAAPSLLYAAARSWPVTDLYSLRTFAWYFIISGLGYGSLAVLLYSAIATIGVYTMNLRRRTSGFPDQSSNQRPDRP